MKKQKIAIVLDSVDRGTIQTSLQANGYYRIVKLLSSSVKNWESICDLLDADEKNEVIVLGKFTEYTLFRMSLPEYEIVVQRLISLLKNKRHVLFIYKDNLFGKYSYFEDNKKNLQPLTNDTVEDYLKNPHLYNDFDQWLYRNQVGELKPIYFDRVKATIQQLKGELNLISYEKLIDIEVIGQNFIENVVEGLLFKLYIPNERIWSSEFHKFIELFREYASKISQKEFKIVQDKTDLGAICSLYSIDENLSQDVINTLYKDFTAFMDLCISNPQSAGDIINKLDIKEADKTAILKKYVKEASRLLLDIKHERENKILSIKHRLESELNEYDISSQLNDYIESAVPSAKLSNLLPSNSPQYHIININPQIIHKVEGIVCNELNGNINLNSQEEELMKIIEQHSKDIAELLNLQSAIYELRDNATSKEKKIGAKQKLYSFLAKVADKIGDVGVSLLSKYLEQQIGL